ncbi:Transcriptional activator flo8 [Coemansia sp. RSA 2336]|nr:Transcriptional activator flo8 [Coemansia sp. RSA 2336]
MVHEALLNAYVFDYLKKQGCLQTALMFAEECKSLPLAETTSEDPVVEMPPGLVSAGSSTHTGSTDVTPSPATVPAPGPAGVPEHAGKASPITQNAAKKYSVPSVKLPLSTPGGFLQEWWKIFWDVFASVSERRPSMPVAENVRAYSQYQIDKRNPKTINANGKRMHSDVLGADGGGRGDEAQQAAKRGRMGDRSPQSEALAERFSQTDDMDALRLTAGAQPAGRAAIPTGAGVHISPAGTYTLPPEYQNYLTRSRKEVTDKKPAHPATPVQASRSQNDNQSNPGRTETSATLNDPSKAGTSAAGAAQVAEPQLHSQQPTGAAATAAAMARSAAAFASPRMISAPVPRTVPTQRAGSQQDGGPLPTSVTAVNMQAIQQMFSPQQGPGGQQVPHSILASPMVANASAADPRSAPGMPTQHNLMAQSAGPQLPTTMRQQTMPGSIGAGIGVSPPEMTLQGGNAAMAAIQSNLAGRISQQAMMAHAHQLQQQQAAQMSGMAQGPPSQLPRNNTVGAASDAPGMRMQGMTGADALANVGAGQPQMPAPGSFPAHFQQGMTMDPRHYYLLNLPQGHLQGFQQPMGFSQAALQQHNPAAGSATPPVLQRRPDSVAADQQAPGQKKDAKPKSKRSSKQSSKDKAASGSLDNASSARARKQERRVQSPPTGLDVLNGNDTVMGICNNLLIKSSSSGGGSGEITASIPNVDASAGASNEWINGSADPLNSFLNMSGATDFTTIGTQAMSTFSANDPMFSGLLAASGTNMQSSMAAAAQNVDVLFSPTTASNPNM